jgi:hypothetical protein
LRRGVPRLRGRACTPRSMTRASSSLRNDIRLANSRWVATGLYDRAVEVGITDICLMGYYTMVSITLAFYDVLADSEGTAR